MSDISLMWITEMMYVAASVVVAIAVWLEAAWMKRNGGKPSDSSLFALASTLGMVWIWVSVAALYFLDFDSWMVCVPVMYVLYTVLNWIYTFIAVADADVSDPEDFIMPPKKLIFSESFAIVFFGLCMLVLFRPESFDAFSAMLYQ